MGNIFTLLWVPVHIQQKSKYDSQHQFSQANKHTTPKEILKIIKEWQ